MKMASVLDQSDDTEVTVKTRAELVRYYQNFVELCVEYPECWHLIMPAEDRMRGERFEHLRRGLTRSYHAGKLPVDVEFDPSMPWDGVFQAAALDHQYWDTNVRRPAVAFLARLGSGSVQPGLGPVSEGAKESLANVGRAVGSEPSVKGDALKKKRKKKTRGKQSDDESKEERPTKIQQRVWKTGETADSTQRSGVGCFIQRRKASQCATPGQRGTPQTRAKIRARTIGHTSASTAWGITRTKIVQRPRREQGKGLGNRERTPVRVHVASSSKGEEVRKFIFLELFAGHAGFTGAVRKACGDMVRVLEEQDQWTTDWDIRRDDHFEEAKKWAREADHCHLAPPCKSMTRARRSDEFGVVEVIRSDQQPMGWGHPLAEEGNLIAERTAILIDLASENQGTFSVENPLESYLWDLPCMKRHVKKFEKVHIDQCAYGAETVKPTGVLTSAEWIKKVSLACGDVRSHTHLKGGLQGKTLDYFYDPPKEVCVKESLKGSTYTKEDWSNLKRKRPVENPPRVEDMSTREKREFENQQSLGGLRNPYSAVARTPPMWKMGLRARVCLLKAMRKHPSAATAAFGGDGSSVGLAHPVVAEAIQLLCNEFNVEEESNYDGPYRVNLWEAMLREGGDPEEDITQWTRRGSLGIEAPLAVNNIFPEVGEDTKAVEAPRAFHMITQEDEVVTAKNYTSRSRRRDDRQRRNWNASKSLATLHTSQHGKK